MYLVRQVQQLRLGAHQLEELHGVQRRLAARLAHRVQRRLEEGHGGDAGQLDRILEGEEHARRRALLRRQRQQRSEENTSELQSLMRTSYDVFCYKKNKTQP